MKLLHISDLHLGRRLGEMPLIEDQAHILHEIIQIAASETPDAVLIAGDVYDKPVPPAEAVRLFDQFLVELQQVAGQVLIISGNHDSGQRLAFGGRLMAQSGVHLAGVFDGNLQRVCLSDSLGEVDVWMLPFVKPVQAAQFFPEVDRDDYTGAIRAILQSAQIDPARRNVLMAHQYVTGACRSESEQHAIGGLDNVDAAVFEAFDYVALGHLHTPQQAGSQRIRYSGSPLAYAFSEAGGQKGVLLVELGAKPSGQHAALTVREVPLQPLRQLRVIRGDFDALMQQSFYAGTDYRDAYVKAVLTDEDMIPDGMRMLRTVYHNILELTYAQADPGGGIVEAAEEAPEHVTPAAYLADFYRSVRGRDLTEEQQALLEELIADIWEGKE